ncbi:hypothetical protein [Virgibacillus sp. 6R]|uniref:hypothetical protein n=1 Tax=Metabacillus sp. 22489 TaxID=3453928 RepID=UPI0011A6ACDF
MFIRKIVILSFIFFLFFSLNVNKINAKDNFILRKVLTGISWTKVDEGTRINLDYIEIKKVGDQETTFGPNTYFIDATDLEYKNLDEEKIEKYLKESSNNSFVYSEDSVYGNYLDIFADVHNENLTKQELDKIVDDAVKEVENYYKQKDQIISGEVTMPQKEQKMESEGQNPIYLWILSAILALFGINILMKILNRKKK